MKTTAKVTLLLLLRDRSALATRGHLQPPAVAELFLVRPQNPLAFIMNSRTGRGALASLVLPNSIVGDGPFGFIVGITSSSCYIAFISIRRDPSIVGAGSD